jgi:hypothetical protein
MNTLSEPPSRLSPRHELPPFPLIACLNAKHPVFRLPTLTRSLDRALPCPAF